MVGGVSDPPTEVVENLAKAAGAEVRFFTTFITSSNQIVHVPHHIQLDHALSNLFQSDHASHCPIGWHALSTSFNYITRLSCLSN